MLSCLLTGGSGTADSILQMLAEAEHCIDIVYILEMPPHIIRGSVRLRSRFGPESKNVCFWGKYILRTKIVTLRLLD